MKRLVFVLALCLLLAGCTQTVPSPGSAGPSRPVAAYIAPDVKAAEVTHFCAGELQTTSIDGPALDALRDWVDALEYEPYDGPDGLAPGDVDGGESFDIVLHEGDYPGFSYILNGEDRAYLLVEGHWYVVSNASRPPVG